MRTAGSALYILKYYNSPLDSLKVSMWFGGDVDSLGSIVLGIVGGRDGLTDIPAWMKEEVENPKYLLQISEDFKKWVEINNL